jgi:Peptidoglycan-synthase activator LpoB
MSRAHRLFLHGLLYGALAACGCAAEPQGTAGVLDPTHGREDMGTLVDMSDVIEVAQRMVGSLRASPQVVALLEKGRPVRIVVEEREVKNLTSMTTFKKRLFLNQMLGLLNRSAGEDFQFVEREPGAAERARQQTGEVKTAGAPDAPAGGDLVLSGRILEKLDQRPATGGATEQTRSVQFSFSLVRVKDAVTVWTDSYFRVKQQVIGTVYG